MTERKRATARAALAERPRTAHAFCPCQDDVPRDQARPVCDTIQGHRGEPSDGPADRCAVCLEIIKWGGRWCGHG